MTCVHPDVDHLAPQVCIECGPRDSAWAYIAIAAAIVYFIPHIVYWASLAFRVVGI